MTPQVEILVHISGPSRGRDDARYRRQALGFLEFEAAERHAILDHEQGEKVHSKEKRSGIQKAFWEAAQRPTIVGTPARDALIPPLRTPKLLRSTTASVLPWSSVKETPHLLIERTPAFPRPRTAPTVAVSSQEAAPRRRTQSDSWQTPPSVVPDSQPTPPSLDGALIASSPYLKRPFASSSPSPTRPSPEPSTKRARLQFTSSSSAEHEHQSDAPSNIQSRPVHISSSPPITVATHLEIHPPRPKTSIGRFETHMTTSLSTLSTCVSLEKVFIPTSSSRKLEPLERGHWLIPITAWEEIAKNKFWKFLTDFVGRGQAGWGIWCVREIQNPEPWKDSDKENRTPGKTTEVAKIYCWGEVVGEVWLVLFLASDRKVKRVGARWVDAGGEAVVVMS
ncbi:hypothetical protein MMC28_009062 [Mycoblastus sanguinarius]|nr:hypothetical protein [Mycoblastus sanguinarius]